MSGDSPAFEMLWDCKSCGTKKLLGVTQRHCPGCGSAQDPKQRYFPPEGQEIALKDHIFAGADKICSACSSPMGAKAAFCTNCGCSLDGTKNVQTKVDGQPNPGHQQRPQPSRHSVPKASSNRKWFILGGIGALLAVLVFVFTWKEKKQLVVTGHSWERVVEIQEFYESSEKSECSSLPSGAEVKNRWSEKRTRDVQDGETCKQECSTARVDQGDGSFRKEKSCENVCKPKYVKETYSVAMCAFNIGRWKTTREAKAEGDSVEPSPEWPPVKLAQGRGNRGYGKEKEGVRTEEYKISMKDSDGESHECTWNSEDVWENLEDDAQVEVEFGITGSPRCDSVKVPRLGKQAVAR